MKFGVFFLFWFCIRISLKGAHATLSLAGSTLQIPIPKREAPRSIGIPNPQNSSIVVYRSQIINHV